jgi:ribosome-associated translation inhibitor RaiA
MKIHIQDRHQKSTAPFNEIVHQKLESLSEDLRIDEAHVVIEHLADASPPYRMTAHLVTPGPDVFAEAVDHTLHATLVKMTSQLEARIEHRHQKREQRGPKPLRTSPRHGRA